MAFVCAVTDLSQKHVQMSSRSGSLGERVKARAQAPESNLFLPDVVHIYLNVTWIEQMLSCTDPPSLHAVWHKYPLSFLKEARLDGIMMDDKPGFCGMRVCFEMQQKDVEKVKDSGFLLEYCRDFIVHWGHTSGNYFSKTLHHLHLDSVWTRCVSSCRAEHGYAAILC